MALYPVRSMLGAGVGNFLPFVFPNPPAPAAPDARARSVHGKHVLITGANSGIGFATAKELLRRGAKVTMACRSATRADKARADLIDALAADDVDDVASRCAVASLDTSSLASVRAFATSFIDSLDGGKIDVLFLNAGIAAVDAQTPSLTDEGFEVIYATNVLGHFLLTYLLEPHLAPDARIISTSSLAGVLSSFSDTFSTEAVKGRAEPGFHYPPRAKPQPLGSVPSAYGQTKAMQVIFARALNDRSAAAAAAHQGGQDAQASPGPRRVALSFHPGLVSTNIFAVNRVTGRRFGFLNVIEWCERLVGLAPDAAAYTPVFLATATEAALAQHGHPSRIWERSRSFPSVLDTPKTERFWKRWCADAGVPEDWSI